MTWSQEIEPKKFWSVFFCGRLTLSFASKESMPKRGREETGNALHSLPPDPLKVVPPFIENITATGFTVCDLIVVIYEMTKLFETEVRISKPCEGSIEFADIPISTWTSDTKKYGQRTELRFDFLDEELKLFLDGFMAMCRIHRKHGNELIRSFDDSAETIQSRIMCDPKLYLEQHESDQIDKFLKKAMTLRLHAYFPTYTWPRWAFSALETFVIRRIQISKPLLLKQVPFFDDLWSLAKNDTEKPKRN